MSSTPRVLVLQPDKGLAESIYRGLRAMASLRVDVDVALVGEVDVPGIRLDRYDLLITEHASGHELPGDLPRVTVGGAPNGTPRTGRELLRVPLPLSFNLLEESVAAALSGPPREDEEHEEAPRKDSVG
jgi:hypothetical protein